MSEMKLMAEFAMASAKHLLQNHGQICDKCISKRPCNDAKDIEKTIGQLEAAILEASVDRPPIGTVPMPKPSRFMKFMWSLGAVGPLMMLILDLLVAAILVVEIVRALR